MNAELVQELYKAFGQNVIVGSSEWVNGHCLFAPWRHSGGVDNNPSFGIRVNPIGESIYKCWTCNSVGSVTDMVAELIMLKKQQPVPVFYDFARAMQLIAMEPETSEVLYSPVDYDDVIPAQEKIIFPQDWLKSFPAIHNHPYLAERGVLPDVVEALDTRIDPVDQRICFPIYGWSGECLGLQGRSFVDSSLRYRLYKFHGRYNRHVWGNMVNVTLDEPVVLTEGFFDLAKILPIYENTLCSLTSSLSVEKLAVIQDAVDVITFYDYGKGGDNARKLIEDYFGSAYCQHVIPDKSVGDAGAMTLEDIKSRLEKFL